VVEADLVDKSERGSFPRKINEGRVAPTKGQSGSN